MHRIILIIFLALTAFASQAQNSPIGQSEIKFKNKTIDYDTIAYASNGVRAFVFTNTGTAPLTIKNVKATCGCTVPQWPTHPIEPQASDSIMVEYNTHRSGAFNKGIIVYSNAKTESVRLIIKGVVETPTTKD